MLKYRFQIIQKNVIAELSKKVSCLEEQLHASKFCLANICEDDNKVLFYTGFPNYATLKVCYDYLGPAVHKLIYWGSKKMPLQHLRPMERADR